ncbi:MAG: CRTAC1 family protein [Planctomycetaceae bacterium]
MTADVWAGSHTTTPASGAIAFRADAVGFEEVTDRVGIRFVHQSPLTPERHTHLAFGSGVAWLDFDHDGWPDLFAAQGAPFTAAGSSNGEFASDGLYRNRSGSHFDDASQMCGLADSDYSMGVAVGDFDNDGFPDVYVSNFGRNRLLRNCGDGTFLEAAAASGVDDAGFGASCTWLDLDSDGSLDLFVANYLDLDPENYQLCKVRHEDTDYGITCHPRTVPPTRDVLFRSLGDGHFSDDTQKSGMTDSPPAQGLGVVAADLDADGDTDVYVANDSVANDLWINDGGGRLINEAVISGTAFNRSGQREAGMGVVAGDVDGDGRPDLFVTNYYGETNTLYRNEGAGLFLDVTDEFGLGNSSRLRLGFGTSLCDFNNDGWLDLFVANGHVHDRPEVLGPNVPFQQRPQLFQNLAGRRFAEVSDSAGPYFQRLLVGRSSAAADYDRDGWQDLAVGHLNSPLVLLHNEARSANSASLQVQLVGVNSNRDAIGAVLEIQAGENLLTRFRVGSSGYLSCDDGLLTIGLGTTAHPADVTVRWPDGKRETFRSLQIGQRHVLIEGRGAAPVSVSPR